MFDEYLNLPLESQMNKTPWPTITVIDVMCAAVLVYKDQGFVRSGQGYIDHKDPENPVTIEDNKTKIVDIIEDPKMLFTQDQYKKPCHSRCKNSSFLHTQNQRLQAQQLDRG